MTVLGPSFWATSAFDEDRLQYVRGLLLIDETGAKMNSSCVFKHCHLYCPIFRTCRDHRCHPLSPPVFASCKGFSILTARRFCIECCQLTLSHFRQREKAHVSPQCFVFGRLGQLKIRKSVNTSGLQMSKGIAGRWQFVVRYTSQTLSRLQ